jgi:hypothetical protein
MCRGYDEKTHEKFAAGKPPEQLRKKLENNIKTDLKELQRGCEVDDTG